ncbi:MAG: hypothetical protein WCA35_28845 [Kovacikia sp.]
METDSADLFNQLQATLRKMEVVLRTISNAVVWIDHDQRKNGAIGV